MTVTLQTERLRTMELIRAFVEDSESVDYEPKGRASAYAAGAASPRETRGERQVLASEPVRPRRRVTVAAEPRSGGG